MYPIEMFWIKCLFPYPVKKNKMSILQIKCMDLSEDLSNVIFKQKIKELYSKKLENVFNPENTSNWVARCRCPWCRAL